MERSKPKANNYQPSIAAYGFDAAGFKIPTGTKSLSSGGSLSFIEYKNADISLDGFDGVIIPQGIFESFDIKAGYHGYHTTIRCNRDLLLERERQVLNLIEQGKWVCFLVGEIVDRVPQGHEEQDVSDTDLCKSVLNSVRIDSYSRKSIKGVASVQSVQNEFHRFITKYGVAKTAFQFPYNCNIEKRILAKSGQTIVGMELLNSIFFLPFHVVKRDEITATEVATWITEAVLDYRQKHSVPMPEWLNDFKFQQEIPLASELKATIEKSAELQASLRGWQEYKTILTTSGDILKERLVCILETFFNCKVDSIDQGREDGKILDDKSAVLAVFEVKGKKTGIKREHINQVDVHRERNGLPPSTPGILFVNNQMDVDGIAERFATVIVPEHITHAVKLGVTIIRTIDLLFLMKHFEPKSLSERSAEFLKLVEMGGGWIKASPDGYILVKE